MGRGSKHGLHRDEWDHMKPPLDQAALLALGLLWMTERQNPKVKAAYTILRDALGGRSALGQAIKAAIDAGYEADHPHGADWWAGKKD